MKARVASCNHDQDLGSILGPNLLILVNIGYLHSDVHMAVRLEGRLRVGESLTVPVLELALQLNCSLAL